MNIYFLKNWQFNHKLARASPTQIPSLKNGPYNLTKYESKWNSDISIFKLFSKLGEVWKYSLS